MIYSKKKASYLTFNAGLDIGSCYCKCVVINENKEIIATSISPLGGNPRNASKLTFENALKSANLKSKNIKNIVCVGRNRKKVSFKSHEESEIKCIAKGARELIPSLRTIVDLGALTNKAIKLNSNGKVVDYVINDKCASGSGMFLELVAKALEMDISDIDKKAKMSENPLPITNQCSIFAESEVIYLVNEGKNEIDIIAGVTNSIANRIYSLLKRVNMEKDIILTGGVANTNYIKLKLEERLNMEIKEPTISPIYIAAFGASLYASEI